MKENPENMHSYLETNQVVMLYINQEQKRKVNVMQKSYVTMTRVHRYYSAVIKKSNPVIATVLHVGAEL